jgi:hypothetical protein
LQQLSALTGLPFAKMNSFSSNPGPQVSFDRPELSPCLGKFQDKNNPQYKEALAIIEAGREMLARHPREDMEGFQPCETDQRREQKYLARREIELRIRAAIREGRKVYEAPPRPSAAAAN